MATEPIIPGFHPDPSICRVGGDFYLVTSSFEYFPGVPIFHSTNLLEWEQIGNVLHRADQFAIPPGIRGASGGIYAPTIRHHGGRFWMCTTNIGDIRKGHLIVHAAAAEGPWSEPVHTTGAIGVDPDLFWDETDACHLTWSNPMGGIWHARVDPEIGAVLSEPHELWAGTGLAHPEGPHLFHREGWWYLVVAEGGTDRGHAVTVARTRSLDEPFVGAPNNPILSHRSTSDPVQSTGHADFVQLADKSWAMVHLGTRPRGSFPKFHVNGRETFLAGIDWIDGWPVVDEARFEVDTAATSFVDEFRCPELHPRWIAPGVDPRSFARPGTGADISAGREPGSRDAVHLLATRVRDAEWQATVDVASGDVAVVLRIDDDHWAALERVGDTVSTRVVIGPLDQVLAVKSGVSANTRLTIRTVVTKERYVFRGGPDTVELGLVENGVFDPLTSVDGRYFSTEVAGGFTGRVIGVEALGGPATIKRFEYAAVTA